jgi:hypothetical protein
MTPQPDPLKKANSETLAGMLERIADEGADDPNERLQLEQWERDLERHLNDIAPEFEELLWWRELN